jgi:hypothetical protein
MYEFVTVNFSGVIVSITNKPQPGRPKNALRLTFDLLTWMALPGAYGPANIALRVIRALELPPHEKAAVLERHKYGLEKRKYFYPTNSLEYI